MVAGRELSDRERAHWFAFMSEQLNCDGFGSGKLKCLGHLLNANRSTELRAGSRQRFDGTSDSFA
jgi:hypothetical protein